MRIGFDVAQTCVPKAGCGWAADLLAKALAENAARDELYLYHQFGSWLNPDTSTGTSVRRPNTREPFRGMPVQAAGELWAAVAAGERQLPGNPEIVHANCCQAPKVGSAKLVYTVYDVSFWVHPEYTTESNRLVCQQGTLEAVSRAAGFVFISESTQIEFERIFPGLCNRRDLASTVAPLAFSICKGDLSTIRTSHEQLAGGWLARAQEELRDFARCARTIFEAIEPSPTFSDCRGNRLEL